MKAIGTLIKHLARTHTYLSFDILRHGLKLFVSNVSQIHMTWAHTKSNEHIFV